MLRRDSASAVSRARGQTPLPRPSNQLMARSRRGVRLGDGIIQGICAQEFVRNTTHFARICRTSLRTLQRRCQELNTSPLSCVHLTWCGHVVAQRTGPWDPDTDLTECCADRRTRRRLIQRGALDRPTRPGFTEFLDEQTIVRSPTLLDEVRAAWRRTHVIYVCLTAEMFDRFAPALMQSM